MFLVFILLEVTGMTTGTIGLVGGKYPLHGLRVGLVTVRTVQVFIVFSGIA